MRIFRSERKEVERENILFVLSTNIRMSKLRRTRWMGHAAHEKGMRTAHN
jgi:hypothetical protein